MEQVEKTAKWVDETELFAFGNALSANEQAAFRPGTQKNAAIALWFATLCCGNPARGQQNPFLRGNRTILGKRFEERCSASFGKLASGSLGVMLLQTRDLQFLLFL